jgi:hypothetical protein
MTDRKTREMMEGMTEGMIEGLFVWLIDQSINVWSN